MTESSDWPRRFTITNESGWEGSTEVELLLHESGAVTWGHITNKENGYERRVEPVVVALPRPIDPGINRTL